MTSGRLLPNLCAAIALLFTTTAMALPIDVVETSDFGDTNSSTTLLGAFDVGLNRVSGSVDRTAADNFDFWHAELPGGVEIISISINVSSSGGAGWRAIVEDSIISSFDPVEYAAWLTTSGDGDFDMPPTTGALPFPSRTYYFGDVTFLGTDTAYDYTWSVEVATVPEPGTATLIGLGLAGLAGRRSHTRDGARPRARG